MTYLTLEIVLIAILAAVSIGIVIKVGINFDLNKWLERRDRKRDTKLMNMCPHIRPNKIKGEYVIESLLVSPDGTRRWHCEQCGRTFNQKFYS